MSLTPTPIPKSSDNCHITNKSIGDQLNAAKLFGDSNSGIKFLTWKRRCQQATQNHVRHLFETISRFKSQVRSISCCWQRLFETKWELTSNTESWLHIFRHMALQIGTYDKRKFKHEEVPTRSKSVTASRNLKQGQHWQMSNIRFRSYEQLLMKGAHTFSSIPTKDPISVTLPDGNKVSSTHKCVLDLPWLPKQAREGHVVPGLTSHSLMSVVTLCNAGCEVTFTKTDVKIRCKGKIILTGYKRNRTGLWMLSLKKK